MEIKNLNIRIHQLQTNRKIKIFRHYYDNSYS